MKLMKPSNGRVTNPYKSTHRAIDYGWGNGKFVRATAAGNVSTDSDRGYGKRLAISHSDGTVTRYAHLASYVVKGGHVQQGEIVAIMGNTGYFAVFVHLHFEYLIKGVKVNPTPYFTDFAGGGGTTPIEDDTKLTRRKKTTWLG